MYEVIVDRCEVTGQNGATFCFDNLEKVTNFISFCFTTTDKNYIEVREVYNAKKSS